jgi:hypothetical protein
MSMSGPIKGQLSMYPAPDGWQASFRPPGWIERSWRSGVNLPRGHGLVLKDSVYLWRSEDFL